jgi:hypothetical protein
MLILGGICLFLNLGFYFITETPVYLLTIQDFTAFKKVMKYIAEVNGRPIDESIEEFDLIPEIDIDEEEYPMVDNNLLMGINTSRD